MFDRQLMKPASSRHFARPSLQSWAQTACLPTENLLSVTTCVFYKSHLHCSTFRCSRPFTRFCDWIPLFCPCFPGPCFSPHVIIQVIVLMSPFTVFAGILHVRHTQHTIRGNKASPHVCLSLSPFRKDSETLKHQHVAASGAQSVSHRLTALTH